MVQLVRICLAGNCTSDPLWFSPKGCTKDSCAYIAEYSYLKESCTLTLKNTTLTDFSYGDILNKIIMTRSYDLYDVSLSYETSPYEISDTGIYLTLTERKGGVFTITEIDPSIYITVFGESYLVSEKRHNDLKYSFTPHEITFNQSDYHNYNKSIVIMDSPGTIHPVFLCDANKIGKYNSSKVGSLQVINGKPVYNDDLYDLVTIGQTVYHDRSLKIIKSDGWMKISSYPTTPFGETVTSCAHSACNISIVDHVLLNYNSCIIPFAYGHYDSFINITGNHEIDYPLFHLGSDLCQDTYTRPEPIEYEYFLPFDLPIEFDWLGFDGTFIKSNEQGACTGQYMISICTENGCGTDYSTGSTFGNGLGSPSDNPDLMFIAGDNSYQVTNFVLADNFVYYSTNGGSTGITGGSSINLATTSGDGFERIACVWTGITPLTGNATIEYDIQTVSSGVSSNNWTQFLMYHNKSRLNYQSFSFNGTSSSVHFSQIINDPFSKLCISIDISNQTSGDILRMDNVTYNFTSYSFFNKSKSAAWLDADYSGLDCIGSLVITKATLQVDVTNALGTYLDQDSKYTGCTQLPVQALGSNDSPQMTLLEFKLINGSIRHTTTLHLNNTAAFDPTFSFSGTFYIPNNNVSSCFYVSSFDTNQESKDSVAIKLEIKNPCINMDSRTYIAPDNDKFVTDEDCTSTLDSYKCTIHLDLVTHSDIAITVVIDSDAIVGESFIVRYDWFEDCVFLCSIPYIRDLSEWFKFFLIALIVFAVLFTFVACIGPLVAVITLLAYFGKACYYLIYYGTWPLRICVRCTWAGVHFAWKWNVDRYDNYIKLKKTNTSIRTDSGSVAMLMICLILIPNYNSNIFGYCCDNEPLQTSNITTCNGDICNTNLDIGFEMVAIRSSQLCIEFTEADTQLGEIAIPKEEVNVTIKDFFVEYSSEFQYYSPWSTLFFANTGCDCPDGSSHSCTSSSHPSGAGITHDKKYYWYYGSTGTLSGCEELFLFTGDGHYCSSFDLQDKAEISVALINDVPQFRMYLSVCRYNGTQDCEFMWHNTTQKSTYSMFDGQVKLILEGYSFPTLPDLSGKSLIKTSGKSWIGMVNELGDYTMGNPGFIQKWGDINYETWHSSTSQIQPTISINHKHCYDGVSAEYTFKYPVFSSWLTDDKTIDSQLGKYGIPEATGFGPTSNLVLYPFAGPTLFGELQTKTGWMTVEVDNACPRINSIVGSSLYEDSTLSTLVVNAYSTCVSGEVEISLTCKSNCESEDSLDVILETTTRDYSLGILATGKNPQGSVCIKSYYENTCSDFNLTTGTKNETDGYAVITEDDSSDNKHDDDLCLTCIDDWIDADFKWDSITNIAKSIFMIFVYICLGIIGLVVILAIIKLILVNGFNYVLGRKKKD